MDAFGKFFASPVGSWLRVFASAMLVAVYADMTNTGGIHMDQWQTYVGAGIVAVVPVIIAALNPKDPRFGVVDTAPVTPPTSPAIET